MHKLSRRFKFFSFLILIIISFFISVFLLSTKEDRENIDWYFDNMSLAQAKDKEEKGDKDRTPPVISDVHTELITETSAVIVWKTDEPSSSGVIYGVDPKTNKKGPEDTALVIDHSIALSELIPQKTYAFCVESEDESKNKAELCDTFFTTETPLPPPPKGGGGGTTTVQNTFSISGLTSPGATITVSLHSLPFGRTEENGTTALSDGSFHVSFKGFPRGIYFFSVHSIDKNKIESGRKGFYFDIGTGDANIKKDNVIIPPTITVLRDIISWGDTISASGMTIPNTGVLVQIGNIAYETKSDITGVYSILINTARLTPGKIHLRARSSLVSEFGYDYSPSQIVTITATTIPKADIDKDGIITLKDFSIFRANPIDMNNDGLINATDVSIFLRAFPNSYKTK